MGAMLELTKGNFDQVIGSAEGPVLVDFWADWCGPCKQLAPTLEEIDSEMPQVTVGRVNVDRERELAATFHIMAIPTLLIFSGGEKVKRLTGVKRKQAIVEKLQKYGG